MLLITDFGCELHLLHRLRYSGPEAQIMREIIANLPTESEGHTYVCEHGHSHRLKLEVQIPESLVTGVYEFDRH